jgi:hypothetical protein
MCAHASNILPVSGRLERLFAALVAEKGAGLCVCVCAHARVCTADEQEEEKEEEEEEEEEEVPVKVHQTDGCTQSMEISCIIL